MLVSQADWHACTTRGPLALGPCVHSSLLKYSLVLYINKQYFLYTGNFMKKVPTATCALRDRQIVSIERVYTPSTFYMKFAVYEYSVKCLVQITRRWGNRLPSIHPCVLYINLFAYKVFTLHIYILKSNQIKLLLHQGMKPNTSYKRYLECTLVQWSCGYLFHEIPGRSSTLFLYYNFASVLNMYCVHCAYIAMSIIFSAKRNKIKIVLKSRFQTLYLLYVIHSNKI